MKSTLNIFYLSLPALVLVISSFILSDSKITRPEVESVEETIATKVDWLTWEEAKEKMKTEKRKIFVDVYTDWCGWCKHMDKNTFQKAHIAKYLNENYYPIKFDGESKETITIKGREYKFVKQGRRGYHELAAAIMGGRLSYPTIVFLDENFNVIQPIPGYQSPEMFEMIATYFGDNHHKTTPWDRYQKKFKSTAKEK